jgi:hypothetical protein
MSSRPYPFLSSIFYKIKKLMSNPSEGVKKSPNKNLNKEVGVV